MAQTTTQNITEDELSAILAGNVDSVLTPPVENEEKEVKDVEDIKEEKAEKFKQPVDTDFSWKELEEEAAEESQKSPVEEKTDVKEDKKAPNKQADEDNKPKPANKKTNNDVVGLINELIEEGDLIGFEDGPVKSADEVKELLKLNIKQVKTAGFEEQWKEKVESLSPQIQAILKYGENGGEDISTLLNAISQVESLDNFDVETEEGQEGIVREFLKVSGFPEEDIKEEIETAKDLNKLRTKAEKFLPKLNQMHQERIDAMMAEQEEQNKANELARQNYLNTIRTTLSKDKVGDIKLSRQDKALLWEGLTDVKYKSWSGQPTNKFFKTLEEIQAGKTADYEHFLEIVTLALDRNGFKNKIKEQLKTEGAVETARQLKIDQRRASNSETLFEEETRKPTVKRTGFKNPFA